MRARKTIFLAGVLVLVFMPAFRATAAAGTPSILGFQGRLTDADGDLLGGSGTTYYFKFSIWDSATVGAGTRLWPASAPASVALSVKQGVFVANIGDTAGGFPHALDYDFATESANYLQIEVSSNDTSFQTLSPRQRITSVPFARVSSAVSGSTTPSSFGTTTPFGASVVSIEATSTQATPLSLRSVLNQIVDIFRIQGPAGNNLVSVDATGLLTTTGLLATASSTIAGNATTTGMHGMGSLFIAGERFTELTGNGLTLSNGSLAVSGVTPAMLASSDFGAFTCNGAACAIDEDAIGESALDFSSVTLADFTNDAGFAAVGAPNAWSALQQFVAASTTRFSAYGPAYFGGTATSSFSSAGILTLASALGSVSGGTGIGSPSAAGILIGSYAGGGWQQLATSSLGIDFGTIAGTVTDSQLASTFLKTIGSGSAGHVAYWSGANLLASAATTTVTGNNGIALSSGAGALIGGSNATIGLAEIAGNSVLGNSAGASGVPSAIATSSLYAGTPGHVLAFVNGGWTGAATTTFSGGLTYSGGNVALDLANANAWTGLQQFSRATSSQFSALAAYFGATGTSTFDGAGILTLPNDGLHLLDTNASHDLVITPGSNLTADRIVTIATGDANRTLTLSADASLGGTNTGDVTLEGVPDYLTISGQALTRGLVNLASHVTGDLPFSNLTQIAANSLLGNNSGATGDVAAVATSSLFSGANGQVLARVNGVWIGVATTTFSSGLTYANGAVTADLGTSITASEIANGDHGDFTYTGGTASIDANAIELATDTAGNFVATLGNSGGLTVAGSGSENAGVTVGLDLANANVWTGLQQFSRATSSQFSALAAYFGATGTTSIGSDGVITVAGGQNPTVDAVGELAVDSNLWASGRGAFVFYDGTAATALINVLVSDAPSNGQVPKWNTDGTITWEDDATSAGGGISTIQENDADVVTSATIIDFLGTDFVVGAVGSEGNVTIDYTNSGITRSSQAASITALWNFLAASSSIFSNTGTAFFGGTATSTFDSRGALSLAGVATTSNLGVRFSASDTNPSCSAGIYGIYADLSETKLKKCENGTLSDLDGNLDDVDYFTSVGSNTWTRPANVSTVYVEVWGGGEAGITAGSNSSGGGGGGGGYSAALVGVDGNETATVGDGGAASGGDGGTSSFTTNGTTVTATGGNGASTVTGGGGGVGSNGDLNLTGGSGGITRAVDASSGAAGGGSPRGGAGGDGGRGANAAGTGVAVNGRAGVVPGGGGGGGSEPSGTGGAGAQGAVIVWEMTGSVSGSDLAELYETEEGVGPGDVVTAGERVLEYDAGILGKQSIAVLKKAAAGDRPVGVISSAPSRVMGWEIGPYAENPQPVALSGRVPVKASAENGPIAAGDLLTLSPVAGVAMRSTKAGPIIGQAMEAYNGPTGEFGTVLVFVNTDYSFGARIRTILEQHGVAYSEEEWRKPGIDVGRLVLADLLGNKDGLLADEARGIPLSELFTDRLAAGLEVVAPRIVANTLVADYVEPALGADVTVRLAADGKLVIGRGEKTTLATIGAPVESVATLDALGNAFFSGALRATTLEVGSPNAPRGIVLYDTETNAPHCIRISGGALVVSAGTCDVPPVFDAPITDDTLSVPDNALQEAAATLSDDAPQEADAEAPPIQNGDVSPEPAAAPDGDDAAGKDGDAAAETAPDSHDPAPENVELSTEAPAVDTSPAQQ